MKILVPVKRTEHPESKIKVKDDGTGIVTEGLKYEINYFDEIALEEAVRLKEKNGGEVVVVSIEASNDEQYLLRARAIGADRAVLVKVDKMPDPAGAAAILKKLVERENPDFVIMGKQAIDDDSNVAGQTLAELLNWPQVTFASKRESLEGPEEKAKQPAIVIEDGTAKVVREIDGGLEEVKVTLPAVITVHDRLNRPRFPALPQIIKAKRKPLEKLSLDDLGLQFPEPKLSVLKFEPVPERAAGATIVETVDELLDKLRNEAKVL